MDEGVYPNNNLSECNLKFYNDSNSRFVIDFSIGASSKLRWGDSIAKSISEADFKITDYSHNE